MIFLVLHNRYYSYLFKSPEIKNYPSISFLVPAYNEQDSLEETIKSLIEIEYPASKKEIIIINDGSTDNTLKIAKSLQKKYSNILVLDKKNSGKANSLNEALKIAKGELIAVVDADSYPKKDALINMVGHFQDLNVAAVTSRVLVKNKNNWLGKFQVMDYSIIAWTRKLLDFVDSVYVTNGPLSIYRKSVVKKLGGFDPKNLTEDIEITWHILSEGYNTRMSYNAIVYTTVPESLKVWIKQRVRWNLGGLQTVHKYWRTMFKKGAFGYFVIPYVSASFVLALIGFFLMMRYLWIKGSYQVIALYYSFIGYDYLRYLEFSMSFTLLLFLGIIFFGLAVYYYKTGFKNSETGNKSVLNILAYSFFYRALYVIPLIIALYKLAKGDIRWYTK
ncbi:MAG: glycosyltransferase family 2 protein [Nanoarchaeota archaeon]|nr:glycosyltransferase family 2 protein [Nanoarchaeota archaeon]